MIEGHDPEADICPGCGVKCVHVDYLTKAKPRVRIAMDHTPIPLKKRGPKPKPHARRQKLTIYISKALRLAIMKRHQTDNVSMVIAGILEDLFPEHRAEAEALAREATSASYEQEKENDDE